MISTVRYFLAALLIIGLVAACGGSDQQQNQQQTQQQQQQEQARQDSIAKARADSIARAKADSIAKAKKKEEQAKKEKEEKDRLTLSDIEFNSNGSFSVQVGAWRSREKAEQLTSTWKERGFSNAYVVKYGNEDTGNIWFRVRLGRVSTEANAQKLQKLLKTKYNENSWVSEVKAGT